MKNKKNPQNSMTQSQALLALLTAQGLLEDNSIDDESRRKAQQERLQKLYHNTQVLLSHYRDIAWVLAGWTRKPAWATGSWNPGWKACESHGCCWTGSTKP